MTETGVLAVRGPRPVLGHIARWAGLRPLPAARFGQIGLLVGVLAAVWLTEDTLRGAVIGSLLLGAVLCTDAIGAESLRAHRDALDAWLAVVLRHLREYAVYGGLALGGALAGVPHAWAWAAGALVAHALRASVGSARAARPETTGPDLPPLFGGIGPGRGERTSADRSFTTELLGGAPGDARTLELPDDVAEGVTVFGGSAATAEPYGDEVEGVRVLGRWADGAGPDAAPSGGAGPDGESAEQDPGSATIRIRTAPDSRGGGLDPISVADLAPGAETARSRAAAAADRCEQQGTAPPPAADPQGTGATRVAGSSRRPDLIRRITAFAQPERCLVVAATVTIWDVRVTFIALTVGCVLATVGDLSIQDATR
ncbi:hypothetical protein HDA32_004812 [Spinactinospora alkalitolerans]|uniref:Transferase n=1 Tax=Spinactinospora alkalitolerans TaxID=687207 RepID=A0A852U2N5_9ACTN|nr:hypothetical protein [Spinactinospora alkalitolerans]NYE49692.1 hypothetical protein [Spinactinospora alkalitolerans]